MGRREGTTRPDRIRLPHSSSSSLNSSRNENFKHNQKLRSSSCDKCTVDMKFHHFEWLENLQVFRVKRFDFIRRFATDCCCCSFLLRFNGMQCSAFVAVEWKSAWVRIHARKKKEAWQRPVSESVSSTREWYLLLMNKWRPSKAQQENQPARDLQIIEIYLVRYE